MLSRITDDLLRKVGKLEEDLETFRDILPSLYVHLTEQRKRIEQLEKMLDERRKNEKQ